MTTQLPRLSECRDCLDPIRFVRMPTGRLMPINPAPHDDASVGKIAARFEGTVLGGYVISRDRLAGPGYPFRFTPHYATCPAHRTEPKLAEPADDPLF